MEEGKAPIEIDFMRFFSLVKQRVLLLFALFAVFFSR